MLKVTRENKSKDSVVEVGKVEFSGKSTVIIAGPCAVESEKQILDIAKGVKKLGANMLRGGAFKPRTSPYAFQGLGEKGLKMLAKAGKAVGLPIVTEIISADDLQLFAEYADMIQIGARNMQNYDLLKKTAKLNKPILLKRGMSATVEEFLLAAEYIINEGNSQIVLCERGIRTFEGPKLDVNSIALIKKLSHLPIIADPSHAAGLSEIVTPLGAAALSAGASGIIVEVHNNPKEALSDGKQSLTIKEFGSMMKRLKELNLIKK